MVLEGQHFVDALVDHMNFDDRLIMLEMYEGNVQEAKKPLDVPLSRRDDSTSLEQNDDLNSARKGLKTAVNLFFDASLKRRALHTDILTTLSIASESISPDRHNCLVLLSDMLQSSKELEFEHLRRIPPPEWIDERHKEGLIRPLYGSVVVVAGADPSTREGVIVRDFWEKYFEKSNASLKPENYRTTPPSDASVCD